MAGSAPLSEHPPVEHPEVRSAIDLLEAWIEAQRVARELPGVSLGIVHDQALVWSGGFGWADVERREPATADTLYRIGSITKLFTATALLILRDAGKLHLDDPLATHLPWFQMKAAAAEAGTITIRHLLTHTSGLPREGAFPYFTDSRFPSIDDIRARLPTQERPLPTETRWKYSNLGATLAGEVVAAVAGEPYVDFVRRRILEPLGMTATLVASPASGHPRLATGYARRLLGSTKAPFNDLRGLTAAGNMTTSVADLARFAMLQLRGGAAGGAQILSGRTLAEMHRVHWLEPDWQAGWGLGFRVLRVRRKTLVGHGGSVRGFRSNLQICRQGRGRRVRELRRRRRLALRGQGVGVGRGRDRRRDQAAVAHRRPGLAALRGPVSERLARRPDHRPRRGADRDRAGRPRPAARAGHAQAGRRAHLPRRDPRRLRHPRGSWWCSRSTRPAACGAPGSARTTRSGSRPGRTGDGIFG